MIEIELKASLNSFDGMTDMLEAFGFVHTTTQTEEDVYYTPPDRDFGKTDEAFRVRACQDEETGEIVVLMTYKGAKQDKTSKVRKELEVAVGNGETAKAIFKELGFKQVYTVVKRRATYTGMDINVCIDEVKNLGNYIEIETIIEDGGDVDKGIAVIMALLKRLSIPESALTRKSYLEMLLEKTMAE